MAEDKARKIESWVDYFENTQNGEPSTNLTEIIDKYIQTGYALDLGSGGGRDTRYLSAKGFKVTAVDADPAAKNYIQKQILEDNVSFVCSKFEDLVLPSESYDLINAQFTLPFVGQEKFNEVFTKVKKSLKKGGYFVGVFFGDMDEWNVPGSSYAFQTEQEARDLLADLDIIRFDSEDEPNATLAGGKSKHWHRFYVIARKPE